MQELAATELSVFLDRCRMKHGVNSYNRTIRNWRYHKELMMWLTKDAGFPEPTPINAEAERGTYVFFNHQTWQRTRVCTGIYDIA